MINNMDFNKIFGRNLRRIMAEREITQAQMSRDLNIPKTTISGWMNGKRAPKMSMFDKICNYLSCKRSDLMEPHTGKSHYHTNPETKNSPEGLSPEAFYFAPGLPVGAQNSLPCFVS